ncbi:MAG: RsmD family RNA methyltransferase [Deltaproteobacteria bacterium]|nr:RsmD family RNA methyltransferase [Deltaproteobacteria bacterium]
MSVRKVQTKKRRESTVILGGRYGNTPLSIPKTLVGVEPTPAAVRRAVFEALPDLQGKQLLDLYAGIGAIGLEAISRGATKVTCVESKKAAKAAITANAQAIDEAAHVTVMSMAVEEALTVLPDGRFFAAVAHPPDAMARPAAVTLFKLLTRKLEALGRLAIVHPQTESLPDPGPLWKKAGEELIGGLLVSMYTKTG